jgi:hypothetical protein
LEQAPDVLIVGRAPCPRGAGAAVRANGIAAAPEQVSQVSQVSGVEKAIERHRPATLLLDAPEKLGISVHTVRTHVQNILAKLTPPPSLRPS